MDRVSNLPYVGPISQPFQDRIYKTQHHVMELAQDKCKKTMPSQPISFQRRISSILEHNIMLSTDGKSVDSHLTVHLPLLL